MDVLTLAMAKNSASSIPGQKGDTGNGIKSTTMNNDYTLTIKFTDGTSYTTPSIRGEKGDTGSKGAKGEKGDQGEQGPAGADGYTPVKGTDYFTDEDKEEMVESMFAEIPHEPYFDEETNSFFACGTHVEIYAGDEEGTLKAVWDENDTKKQKSLVFPESTDIFGGGNGLKKETYYPAGSVTLNSGNVKRISGGSLGHGVVGHAMVVINGGYAKAIAGGGIAHYNGVYYNNTTGYSEVIINGSDKQLYCVFATSMNGLTGGGHNKITINGGEIYYVTASGSNGYTGFGEVEMNGGKVEILQGCNRGKASNIKITVNGGEVENLYAGGETGDSTVNAVYGASEVHVLGGTVNAISAGTNGGVEDATKVSGTYRVGVLTDEQVEVAKAMNLVEAPIVFTDVTIEDTSLVYKNGDVVVKSVDLAAILA